jgi:hypothetical protein
MDDITMHAQISYKSGSQNKKKHQVKNLLVFSKKKEQLQHMSN